MRRNYLWNCVPAMIALAVLAGCSYDASESAGSGENDEETNCEEPKCEENDCVVSQCGDGKLTSGELCEGDQFAEGVKVCPGDMIEVPDPVYTCTNTCMVDISKACVSSQCGDGKLTSGELCEGDQFAEGVKVCPGDMIEVPDPVYTCTNTCMGDISKACVSSVCGDGKLTGLEPCDGDLFREDAKVCPDGKTKIEGRDLFSCNLCTIDASYACYGNGEKVPKLYFSELRVEVEDGSSTASHLYVEIGNLGSETTLNDCKLVGLNLDENDNTKLSSTYAFEYPLNGVLGNTAFDPHNVLNICYESKEGWLKSKYGEETASTREECENEADKISFGYYKCIADYCLDNDNTKVDECIKFNCGENNSDNYLDKCMTSVHYKTIESACDIVIPVSDNNLLLTVTRSTYKSEKFWGLGLVCGDGMHDVFRVLDTPNAYNGWQRWCPKLNDLSSIEATGETIYSTSEEYWGTSPKSLASSADNYPSYDYAYCAGIVIN